MAVLAKRYVLVFLLLTIVLSSCSSDGIEEIQRTPSQTILPIPTVPVTQTPRPLSAENQCFVESYGIDCFLIFELPMATTGIYAISPQGDLWMVEIENHRSDGFTSWLVHVTPTGELEKIPLKIGVTDIKVTDSSIWILDMALLPELPKLYQLDLSGNLVFTYDIPREFLLDSNGQYQEFGIDSLYFGVNGELLLGGITGMWQLLDEHALLAPRRLDGLPCGTNICAVDDPALNVTQTAFLKIGDKQVVFTTDADDIYLYLCSATPDGGVWVLAVEINDVAAFSSSKQYSIYRFNSAGEELGHAVVTSPYFVVDGSGIIYRTVNENNVTYVFRMEIAE